MVDLHRFISVTNQFKQWVSRLSYSKGADKCWNTSWHRKGGRQVLERGRNDALDSKLIECPSPANSSWSNKHFEMYSFQLESPLLRIRFLIRLKDRHGWDIGIQASNFSPPAKINLEKQKDNNKNLAVVTAQLNLYKYRYKTNHNSKDKQLTTTPTC